MKYLLDSNALNEFIERRAPFADHLREARANGHRIGTCEPVVAEMFYGVELSSTRDRNMQRLRRALVDILCWPFDRKAAEEYGRLAALLRRRGRPMQLIDVMIAAVALSLSNCVVVTTDSDFSAVPGLNVVDWTKP